MISDIKELIIGGGNEKHKIQETGSGGNAKHKIKETGSKLLDIGLNSIVLNLSPQAKTTKAKTYTQGYIKLKSFLKKFNVYSFVREGERRRHRI